MVAICNRSWGWGAVCGWEGRGESGLAGRDLSSARERCATECFVETMFGSKVFHVIKRLCRCGFEDIRFEKMLRLGCIAAWYIVQKIRK